MSTSAAPVLPTSVQRDTAELVRRKRERPIDFYHPFSYQSAFHSATEKERWFVAGNRTGKTVAGAAEVVALVTGRAKWWKGGPSEVWCGAISLADSEMLQRRAVRRLIPKADIQSWPNERNPASESTLTLRNGWIIRFKATNQGRERWQGGSVALVWFDEEPPADVWDEAYTRTVDVAGRLIVTFTPLNGLRWQDAYERVYQPWCDHAKANPGARWGSVAPDIHVTTAAMRDNPTLPPLEIERMRERYAHRPLMLRVRLNGEWLDVAEDAVIPADKLREWESVPKGGWNQVAAWVDPAFSSKETSDEFCISVAASDFTGKLYLLEQVHGRFDADERIAKCINVLKAHGQPVCYVQRTTPDVEFAQRLNEHLMAAGMRAAVIPWPEKGAVPGKVERAQSFAAMVGNGQVYIRQEHRSFRRQASTFPHSEHDDVLDSGMGALMMLVERAADRVALEAMRDAGKADRERELERWHEHPEPAAAGDIWCERW